ncbi:MAG: DMT family transporter [Ruminiclostridium sp.]|nr:DMT family transporter [Ruminiclostridium sp.]
MIAAVIATTLTGFTIVINRIINSRLAQRIGIFQSTLYNYITGLFVSVLFAVFSRETIALNGLEFGNVPFWAYLGGFIGVITIVLSSYLTPRISALYLTLLLFIGQLFTGIIIDYFNSGEFSWPKLIGGIFVLTGLSYNLFVDYRKEQETAKVQ